MVEPGSLGAGGASGRSRDRSRRRRAVVAAVVVASLAAGGTLAATRPWEPRTATEPAETATGPQAGGGADTGRDAGPQAPSGGGASVEVTDVAAGGDAGGGHRGGGDGDAGVPQAPSGGTDAVRGTRPPSAGEAEVARYAEAMDRRALSDTAAAFVREFLTYNSATLSDGGWREGCLRYVSDAGMAADPDGVVARRLATPEWSRTCGRYTAFQGTAVDVRVESVYAVRTQDPRFGEVGTIHPVAYVRARFDENLAEPWAAAFWDGISEYEAGFMVNFWGDTGEVGSVTRMDERELSVVRETSYMMGLRQ